MCPSERRKTSKIYLSNHTSYNHLGTLVLLWTVGSRNTTTPKPCGDDAFSVPHAPSLYHVDQIQGVSYVADTARSIAWAHALLGLIIGPCSSNFKSVPRELESRCCSTFRKKTLTMQNMYGSMRDHPRKLKRQTFTRQEPSRRAARETSLWSVACWAYLSADAYMTTLRVLG
jgi:hypothetical protein